VLDYHSFPLYFAFLNLFIPLNHLVVNPFPARAYLPFTATYCPFLKPLILEPSKKMLKALFPRSFIFLVFKKHRMPFSPRPYLLDFNAKKSYNKEQYFNSFARPPYKRRQNDRRRSNRYGYEIDREQVAGKVGEIQTKQFQQEKYRQEIIRTGNVFLPLGREIARRALV
jgi:hypothetical protein